MSGARVRRVRSTLPLLALLGCLAPAEPPPTPSARPIPGEPGAAGAQGSEPALVADRRFVRTGEVREDRVAITEGLKAGEQIITTGQVKLNPCAAIRIDNTQPLQPATPRPKQ